MRGFHIRTERTMEISGYDKLYGKLGSTFVSSYILDPLLRPINHLDFQQSSKRKINIVFHPYLKNMYKEIRDYLCSPKLL